jgi:hypothetical protein
MEITDRVAEGEVAPEDLLEEISIPGVPEDTLEWEDYDGWSAGAVRSGIEAIATATDEVSEELLKVATDSARRNIIGKEQAAGGWSGISSGCAGSACCQTTRPWRRLPDTRPISPQGSTRLCTSSRPCRRDEPALPLPWPV